ncbi:hypothetical protein TNCV_1024171 [Trichonephila clavipes]|nr:hypothetical protein TNCV_1024171 [Trichonephila clavipes]
MARFQSPLWILTGGHICFDSWYEPRLRAASRGNTYHCKNSKNECNKPSVNEVSKAHLDPKDQEVELQAAKKHCEELQDFNTKGKY